MLRCRPSEKETMKDDRLLCGNSAGNFDHNVGSRLSQATLQVLDDQSKICERNITRRFSALGAHRNSCCTHTLSFGSSLWDKRSVTRFVTYFTVFVVCGIQVQNRSILLLRPRPLCSETRFFLLSGDCPSLRAVLLPRRFWKQRRTALSGSLSRYLTNRWSFLREKYR